MKLQPQAFAGFAVGAIITIGVAMFFMPSKKDPFYSAAKIDGNALKELYNAEFSELVLNFRYNISTSGFDLEPAAFNADRGSIEIRDKLLSVLSSGKNIAGDRTLVPISLEHNRVSELLQLKTLIEIVDANPDCYFILNPDDYDVVEASEHKYIYFKIVAYDKAGKEIDVSRIETRALQLNPSPPGRLY